MDENEVTQNVEQVVETSTAEQRPSAQVDLSGIEERFTKLEATYKAENDALKRQLEDVKKSANSGVNEASELRNKLSEALGVTVEEKESTPEDMFNQLSKTYDEKLAAIESKFNSKLKEANKTISELHSARLSEVKKRLVAENNGELVEGMLLGNSEAEILASLDAAKEAYQSIASRFNVQQEQAVKQVKQQTQLPSTTQVASGAVQGKQEKTAEQLVEEMYAMSDEEFMRPENQERFKRVLGQV